MQDSYHARPACHSPAPAVVKSAFFGLVEKGNLRLKSDSSISAKSSAARRGEIIVTSTGKVHMGSKLVRAVEMEEGRRSDWESECNWEG